MPKMAPSMVKRLNREQTPLLDGNLATFVWLGETAPYLVGDFCDWERGGPLELTRIEADVWACQVQLPNDAYIEYAFWDGEDRYIDPRNHRKISNGLGKDNNFFYMPGARPTDLAQHRAETPHGVVTRHMVPTHRFAVGRERLVYLYQPPVDEPASLLVVWDGRDFLRRASLVNMLDNLIAARRIQPVAMAMVENGREARLPEYACSDATLAFLGYGVLPLAAQHLNLVDVSEYPGAWGVMGASMGGLMALYAGLRMPEVFGHVLSLSGAFSLDDWDTVVFDLAARPGVSKPAVWMNVGLYDIPSLLEANRRMFPHLQAHEFSTEYREYPAGHNYPAWRDEVWRGLEYLYGSSENKNYDE
jgi:enterochelin esterase-like enzyme